MHNFLLILSSHLYFLTFTIGPSAVLDQSFEVGVGILASCRRPPKKGQKMAFLGGPPGPPKNGLFWPFLGVMSGQVHLILAFFGKNMSLIRGGTPLLGGPPGGPPGGSPPGGTPQDPPPGGPDPLPLRGHSPAAARIPTPTP